MSLSKLNTPALNKGILAYFIFASLFLTIRLLWIGSEASDSAGEFLLSMLPELFVFGLSVYFFAWFIQNRKTQTFHYLDWFILIYIISNVLLGTFLAHDLKLSMYAVRMSYLPMIFYFFTSFSDGGKPALEKLTGWIFALMIAIAVTGLILYFGFYDAMIFMIKKTTSEVAQYFIVRMTSIFWTPVHFATFMSVTLIYFFYRSTQKISWQNLLIQAIIGACVFMSVTRGAMIVLLIGLILMTFFSRNWKALLYTLLVLAGVFLLVSLYISNPAGFVKWIMTSTSETVGLKKGVTRVDLWSDAISSFKHRPLGQGLGKAGHVAARFFDENSKEASVASTDGWFLKLANETGLWGLLTYFTLSITLFVVSVKHLLKNGYGFYSFLFTVFIIVNIQNLVSNILDFYMFSYFYWLLIGIMVYHLKTSRTHA